MVSLTEYDARTRCSQFIASTEDDLYKLPTTKDWGKEELKNNEPVIHGSCCLVIENSQVYLLDGDDDTWKTF